MTVASNAVVGGTLAVSNTATFATNVSVAGSLSVGSFTTTTPSTWALDATQTAAATNGVLTLPSNANVIRLTNNNAISSVTNGVLGAFYYLVNQATNAVTISNVGGITIDGAQNLTLSPNESATLVATGPTNVSVANRGDLTDVALGGTANTAPSQTASSGSSLMTRDLADSNPLWNLGSVRPMGAFASTNSGTGSSAAITTSAFGYTFGGAILSAGTASNGYGRVTLQRGLNSATSLNSVGINFSQSIAVAAVVSFGVQADVFHRIMVGAPGAAGGSAPLPANSNALTARGFGVEFTRTSTTNVSPAATVRARLFAHDGSSYSTSAYTADFAGDENYQHNVIVSSSNGVVRLYLGTGAAYKSPARPSTTPLLTLSNGPAAGGSQYIEVASVNTTTNAPATAPPFILFNSMVEVKD
jgi:hypothetical protein